MGRDPKIEEALVESVLQYSIGTLIVSVTRNTFYNMAGTLIPAVVALITIPAYIHVIGLQRYGVLAIVWLFVGYFGVFDLGIGRAVAQRIASISSVEARMRREVFWTALSINAAFGLLGSILLLPASAYYFGTHVQLEEILREELFAVLPLLMVCLPVSTLSGTLNGSLQGVEKFLHLNAINSLASIFFYAAPLLAALIWGPRLAVVISAVLATRVASLLALFLVCKRHVIQHEAPLYSRHEARRLLGFGGWVTLSSLVSPILVLADRLIIGAMLGAKSVAHYSVPYQLAERTSIASTALASSLFPRFSRSVQDEGKALAVESVQALIAMMTPACVVAILGSWLILSLWISPSFADDSSHVLQLLLVGFWANSLARVPHAMLQAVGRPRAVALAQTAELLPFLAALYYSTEWFGLAGAATIICARLALDFGLLSWLAGILKPLALRVTMGLALQILALIVTQSEFNPVTKVLATCALILVAFIWAWRVTPLRMRAKIGQRMARRR